MKYEAPPSAPSVSILRVGAHSSTIPAKTIGTGFYGPYTKIGVPSVPYYIGLVFSNTLRRAQGRDTVRAICLWVRRVLVIILLSR